MDGSTLECPICMETYESIINMCENGHSICAKCKVKMDKCPRCRSKLTSKRNYDLEKLVDELRKFSNIKFSCQNKGCTYKLLEKERDIHEIECKYRTHICQTNVMGLSICPWNGSFDKMLAHYNTEHKELPVLPAVSRSIQQPITFKNYKSFYLIDFLRGKQLFYLKSVCNATSMRYYWVFQFVGPKHEAKNYIYEFEINKGPAKFKINGLCVADSVDEKGLIDEEDCVSMSFKQIQHYMDEKKDICIQFRIFSKPRTI